MEEVFRLLVEPGCRLLQSSCYCQGPLFFFLAFRRLLTMFFTLPLFFFFLMLVVGGLLHL